MIKFLMLKLFRKVPTREITHLKLDGKWFRIISAVSSGKYETYYIIDDPSADEGFSDVLQSEVEEFRSSTIWVDEDSLAGIMTKVTFNPNDLRNK